MKFRVLFGSGLLACFALLLIASFLKILDPSLAFAVTEAGCDARHARCLYRVERMCSIHDEEDEYDNCMYHRGNRCDEGHEECLDEAV